MYMNTVHQNKTLIKKLSYVNIIIDLNFNKNHYSVLFRSASSVNIRSFQCGDIQNFMKHLFMLVVHEQIFIRL